MSTGPADSAHTPNESKKSLSGSTSSFLAFRADGFADGTEADRPAARSGAGGGTGDDVVRAVCAGAGGAGGDARPREPPEPFDEKDRCDALRGIFTESGSEPSDWIVWRRLFDEPKPFSCDAW